MLRLLPRLGLQVADLFPGAVLVTRAGKPAQKARVETRALAEGSFLVRQPGAANKHRLDMEKEVTSLLLQEHLMGLFAHYRVDCVLDVGANKGQYARMLRRAGFRGQIVSFEPVPDAFAELTERAQRDSNWSVHQMALGRSEGVTQMQVAPGTMSSLLTPSAYGTGRYKQLREVTEVDVPVRRLDAVLADLPEVHGKRLFLKMDTQGFDLEAFAGLGERVDSVVAMQSEVALLTVYDQMPRLPEALPVYEAAGFGVTAFYPVSRERETWRVLEFDCVMARADAL